MKFPHAATLAALLATTSLPGYAADGRIVFVGRIVEATCPMRGAAADCPPDRPKSAVVRHLDAAKVNADIHAALLDYALARDASARWSFVEVTYR
ncbi:MAG: hypothetical protein ABW193_10835 [Luteibacter sp.]